MLYMQVSKQSVNYDSSFPSFHAGINVHDNGILDVKRLDDLDITDF